MEPRHAEIARGQDCDYCDAVLLQDTLILDENEAQVQDALNLLNQDRYNELKDKKGGGGGFNIIEIVKAKGVWRCRNYKKQYEKTHKVDFSHLDVKKSRQALVQRLSPEALAAWNACIAGCQETSGFQVSLVPIGDSVSIKILWKIPVNVPFIIKQVDIHGATEESAQRFREALGTSINPHTPFEFVVERDGRSRFILNVVGDAGAKGATLELPRPTTSIGIPASTFDPGYSWSFDKEGSRDGLYSGGGNYAY